MLRSQILKTMFFVAILAALAADISVGCGNGYVYGPVDQKITYGGDNSGVYQIYVNREPYDVPISFYTQVQVGDIVKYDGHNWSIVKRASSVTPASPPAAPPPASPPSS